MTPMAHRIVKELTLPIKRRGQFVDRDDVLARINGIHCFEVSDGLNLCDQLWRSELERGRNLSEMVEHYGFLPAPKTWIEYIEGPHRVGYLLEEEKDTARLSMCVSKNNKDARVISLKGSVHLPLMQVVKTQEIRFSGGFESNFSSAHGFTPHMTRIFTFLAMINTPRIVGRRQHMPHRGLERRLVAQKAMIGKFPLHAWTEIKLAISDPRDASADPSREAHYTGERALHFCRAHLRIRFGRVVIVSAHWRGNGALGIKQSRYRLTRSEAA